MTNSNELRDKMAEVNAEEWCHEDFQETFKSGFKLGWGSCKKHDPDVLAMVEALQYCRERVHRDYCMPHPEGTLPTSHCYECEEAKIVLAKFKGK